MNTTLLDFVLDCFNMFGPEIYPKDFDRSWIELFDDNDLFRLLQTLRHQTLIKRVEQIFEARFRCVEYAPLCRIYHNNHYYTILMYDSGRIVVTIIIHTDHT